MAKGRRRRYRTPKRKRLKSDLQKLSVKELWRVEHELREGLAQHLTGVVLISHTLAENLSAKSLPEATDAKKITKLVSEAVVQALELADKLYSATLD